MANIRELLLKRRKDRRAKDADKLEPNGAGPGTGSVPFPFVDKTASGEQAEPNPSG